MAVFLLDFLVGGVALLCRIKTAGARAQLILREVVVTQVHTQAGARDEPLAAQSAFRVQPQLEQASAREGHAASKAIAVFSWKRDFMGCRGLTSVKPRCY